MFGPMGIVADDIARVRAATDIVAIIGEHTEIKRSGRQWMARCPLHGERTPSLSVSPDKGVYYCFGCQRSGDVITFVQEIEGLDFAGAVEMLAGRAGIRVQYTSRDESAARSRRRRLLESVAKARDFYHQRLLDGPDAGPARHYLRSRGYDGDLVRRWKLGWAPDGWDHLAKHLRLTDDDLRDSGLGFVNRGGRQQDFFRGRILFPISDERGDPVGFGGRIMPGVDGPKYLNTSTEAKTYDKSRVLYGLHEHRKEIVKAGQAVVCEGYTDVIGCAEAGIELAVATCGTALTEEHVRLLKRFSARPAGAGLRRRRRGRGRRGTGLRLGAPVRAGGAGGRPAPRQGSRRSGPFRAGSSPSGHRRTRSRSCSSGWTGPSPVPTCPPSRAGPGPQSGP